MKILLRNTVFFILTAIILLSTVTCVDPGTDELSVYFDTLNISGEQVWMPNYNTGKVSQMLLKFEGDRNVDVIVIEYTTSRIPIYYTVGTGKIEGGILNFNVGVMNDE